MIPEELDRAYYEQVDRVIDAFGVRTVNLVRGEEPGYLHPDEEELLRREGNLQEIESYRLAPDVDVPEVIAAYDRIGQLRQNWPKDEASQSDIDFRAFRFLGAVMLSARDRMAAAIQEYGESDDVGSENNIRLLTQLRDLLHRMASDRNYLKDPDFVSSGLPQIQELIGKIDRAVPQMEAAMRPKTGCGAAALFIIACTVAANLAVSAQ